MTVGGPMFRILDRVGDDLIVGTYRGNVGVMSLCVMGDLELTESTTLRVVEVPKNLDVYRSIVLPPTPVSAFTDNISPRGPDYTIEDTPLKTWRYDNLLLRVGFSKATKTWIVSRLSGQR